MEFSGISSVSNEKMVFYRGKIGVFWIREKNSLKSLENDRQVLSNFDYSSSRGEKKIACCVQDVEIFTTFAHEKVLFCLE